MTPKCCQDVTLGEHTTQRIEFPVWSGIMAKEATKTHWTL